MYIMQLVNAFNLLLHLFINTKVHHVEGKQLVLECWWCDVESEFKTLFKILYIKVHHKKFIYLFRWICVNFLIFKLKLWFDSIWFDSMIQSDIEFRLKLNCLSNFFSPNFPLAYFRSTLLLLLYLMSLIWHLISLMPDHNVMWYFFQSLLLFILFLNFQFRVWLEIQFDLKKKKIKLIIYF